MSNAQANAAFQYFIDRATNMSFNRRPIVATTVARNGMTRAVSRGSEVWRFDVTVPDGLRYSDIRTQLTEIDRWAQFTDIDVSFDKASYIFNYRGNRPVRNNLVVTTPLNVTNQVNFANLPAGQVVARLGDLIKIDGRVYSVTGDVIASGGGTATATLHRNLIGVTANTTYSNVEVGEQIKFRMRAIQIPTFTLFGFDQVAWNGSFQFVERI
jgi:hypothetical protein